MTEALSFSPAIEARALSKSYRDSGPEVVSSLDFSIDAGEAVAFLGPNGAGKSTTIKMLCGILTPTRGEALIFGGPAGTRTANQRLGLVFGTRSQLYLHMTVRQCLDLVAEIYDVTGAEKRARIDKLAERFSIQSLLRERVRSLSLGQRMRCEVVAALIHRPRILLADEPTIGLDVLAKNELRELVREWKRDEKTTLMLTSHDLSDVEALCDRCILIDEGKKRFDGAIDALKGELSALRRVWITSSSGELKAFGRDSRLRELAQESAFVHQYELSTREIPISEALGKLSQHYGDHLQDIQIHEVSLEEVLARLYRRGPSV